jgi:ADP-heptose:LPS heptosyltransferase
MSKEPKHIIISRTDAIGDVVLTLPLAYYLKQKFPAAKITWLGRTYTQTVIKACSYIDNFVNSDEWDLTHTDAISNVLKALNADAIIHVFPNKHLAKAAKLAGIKIRIGTSHRLYHWLTCSQLVNLGRKNSPLHEAQLNISLARYFGTDVPSLDELKHLPILLDTIEFVPFDFLANEKKKIIFHPKSRGSGKEWPLYYYLQLIDMLDADKYQIIICGTSEEGAKMGTALMNLPAHVVNLIGKLSLADYLSLMQQCNGLLAASTGPLHLASCIGVNALGLYPPTRPLHPGRWAPIGRKASYLCSDRACETCKIKGATCECMQLLTPKMVFDKISQWN